MGKIQNKTDRKIPQTSNKKINNQDKYQEKKLNTQDKFPEKKKEYPGQILFKIIHMH